MHMVPYVIYSYVAHNGDPSISFIGYAWAYWASPAGATLLGLHSTSTNWLAPPKMLVLLVLLILEVGIPIANLLLWRWWHFWITWVTGLISILATEGWWNRVCQPSNFSEVMMSLVERDNLPDTVSLDWDSFHGDHGQTFPCKAYRYSEAAWAGSKNAHQTFNKHSKSSTDFASRSS